MPACAQERSPTPAASDAPQYHVETWAGYKYGAANEGRSSPPSTLRTWATYVESDGTNAQQICNVAGHPCNSVAYVNMGNIYFGSCGWSDAVVNGGLRQQGTIAESAWLHDGPAMTYSSRIFLLYNKDKCSPSSPNTGLYINKKSVSGPGNALAFFNAFYQRRFGTSSPDFYMSDDNWVVNHFYNKGEGKPASEFASWTDLQNAQATWMAGVRAANGAAVKMFFNGCNANPYIASAVSLVRMRPNIVGCITEGNVSADIMSRGREVYALDNCARVSLNTNGGIFVNGPDVDQGEIARRQATAFNWLCYVPGRVVEWEESEFGAASANLFPEEGLYPARPLQSMQMPSGCPDETLSANGPGNDGDGPSRCASHGHNDLAIDGTPDVYRREFGSCYNRRVPIGRCAVIWNMSGATITVRDGWLTHTYAHAMLMRGGTIDEGGSVSLTQRIVPSGTSIGPFDALFLFQ